MFVRTVVVAQKDMLQGLEHGELRRSPGACSIQSAERSTPAREESPVPERALARWVESESPQLIHRSYTANIEVQPGE